MIKYIKGDLFTSKNSLAHCISKDLVMGAGIAVIFSRKWGDEIRDEDIYRNTPIGECLTVEVENSRYVFNLITKKYCYLKPNILAVEKAIIDMFKDAKALGIKVISMPKIGCGLDKLQWGNVSELIEKYQGNIDVEVYTLGNK